MKIDIEPILPELILAQRNRILANKLREEKIIKYIKIFSISALVIISLFITYILTNSTTERRNIEPFNFNTITTTGEIK